MPRSKHFDQAKFERVGVTSTPTPLGGHCERCGILAERSFAAKGAVYSAARSNHRERCPQPGQVAVPAGDASPPGWPVCDYDAVSGDLTGRGTERRGCSRTRPITEVLCRLVQFVALPVERV